MISEDMGIVDVVSYTSKCTSERVTQSTFYCGYDCDTTVNNIFAYGPDGKVFPCT